MNNKNINVYTKNMVIKKIARGCRRNKDVVKEIYEELEKNIFLMLQSADTDNDVVVRLFDGISVESTYVPEREKLNNLTGEKIVTKSKIKPRFNITRPYREKLSYNK